MRLTIVALGDAVLDASPLGEVWDLGPVLIRVRAGAEGAARGVRVLGRRHGREGVRVRVGVGDGVVPRVRARVRAGLFRPALSHGLDVRCDGTCSDASAGKELRSPTTSKTWEQEVGARPEQIEADEDGGEGDDVDVEDADIDVDGGSAEKAEAMETATKGLYQGFRGESTSTSTTTTTSASTSTTITTLAGLCTD